MVKIHLGIAVWQVSTLCMRLLSEDSEDIHVSSIRSLGIMAFKIKWMGHIYNGSQRTSVWGYEPDTFSLIYVLVYWM